MTEYVLIENLGSYFYAEWTNDYCLWSNWHDSIEEALEAPLDHDVDSETLTDYLASGAQSVLYYRSTTPLNPNNHTELFL